MTHEIEYGLNTVGHFRLLNFATGSYMCRCSVCGKEFYGDKRSVQCLACALKAVEENCHSTQRLKAKICAEMRDAVDNMQDGIADGLKSMVREWERKLSAC